MGTLTGSGFDTDVRAIIGNPGTSELPTATLLRFINSAYIEDVCLRWDLLELRTSATSNTTASTQAFTSSANACMKFLAIHNAAGQVLIELTPEVESRFAVPVAVLTSSSSQLTGVPTHYIRKGGAAYSTLSFLLYPTPDGIYPLTVWFVSRPSVIGDATATAIDALWDQVILHYAASRAAAFRRMYDDATQLRSYADRLAQNIAKAFDLPETGRDQVATSKGDA